MSHNPHKRLFLSCASSEFGSSRKLLTDDLRRTSIEVKLQEDFGVAGRTTLEKLDKYIKTCDAVIHLISDATGATPEPPAVERLLKPYPHFTDRLKPLARTLAAKAPGTSYSQWEAEALLDIALAHLTLGRAMLLRLVLTSRPKVRTAREGARRHTAAAMDHLHAAGRLDVVPGGLITREWLSYVDDDLAGVGSDLKEAWEIAECGPMPLYQADILLYRARLFRDRTALSQARELIERHGYHRRDEELRDAEAALASGRPAPNAES